MRFLSVLLPLLLIVSGCGSNPGTDTPTEVLLERIEEHLEKHPEDGERHMGFCGNPMDTAVANFKNIISDSPPEDIIPLLEHRAFYLRRVVYSQLYEAGEEADEAIREAYASGNARIKYMLLDIVDPEPSAEYRCSLLDEIIHDESIFVFFEDYSHITGIMQQESDNNLIDTRSIENFPVDIYTYLLRLLNESDYYEDKAWAARKLGSFGEEASDVIPDIISLFVLEDSQVSPMRGGFDVPFHRSLHGAAATALGDFGPLATDAVPVLLEAFNSTETGYYVETVRIQAASSLYLIGHNRSAMLGFLIDKLESTIPENGNLEYVGDIAAHLGRIGPDANGAVSRLMDLAFHEHHWVNGPARNALSSIEGNDDTAIRILIRQLGSSDEERVHDAVYSLCNMGSYDDEEIETAVPVLLNVMARCDGYCLREIGERLVQYGGLEEEVTSRIVAALDNRVNRYNQCIYVLNRLGPSASDAIPSLQNLILDDDEVHNLNSAAGTYLAVGGDVDWLMPRLIELLYWDKTTYNADDVAMWILKDIGPDATDALPVLREIAQEDDSSRVMFANQAIAAIEGTGSDGG